MPPFGPKKYSAEQKAELCRLVIDERMKVREATAILARGSNGVEPVEMKITSANSFVFHEKKRRAGKLPSRLAQLPPEEATEELRQRALKMVEVEMELVEKTTPLNLERLKSLVKTAKEISTMGKASRQGELPQKTIEAKQTETSKLLRKHRQDQRGTTDTDGVKEPEPDQRSPREPTDTATVGALAALQGQGLASDQQESVDVGVGQPHTNST